MSADGTNNEQGPGTGQCSGYEVTTVCGGRGMMKRWLCRPAAWADQGWAGAGAGSGVD